MSSLFPCGDQYRPGYVPIPTPIKKPPPGGGDLIAIPPDDPIPPIIIPPHEERSPVPLDPSPGIPTPGVPTGPGNTQYTLWGCRDIPIYCPDGFTVKRIDKRCVESPPLTGFPPPPAILTNFPNRTLAECRARCGPSTGAERPCPTPPGPTTGGGVTPYQIWKCQRTPVYCPDGVTITYYNKTCVSITLTVRPIPPVLRAEYPFDTQTACLAECGPDSNRVECPPDVDPDRIYGIPPPPPVGEDPRDPEDTPTVIRTGVNRLLDVDRTTSTRTGTISLFDINIGVVNPLSEDRGTTSSKTTTLAQLRDSNSGSLFFSQQDNASGRSNIFMYDQIRNIFNYSGKIRDNYIPNNSYRNILGETVCAEISYIMNNYDSSAAWKEKVILPITLNKIYNSLNRDFAGYIDNILDVDGRKIRKEIFLRGIFNHVINNTLSSIDVNYYRELSETTQNRSQLLLGSNSLTGNPRRVLDFVKSKMQSADPSRYPNEINKIEIARLRFLPSDIKAKIPVETVAEETYTVGLDDPGLAFQTSSTDIDYVPLGDGDGYYITLETSSGEQPIVLQTSLNNSYYLPLQDRKIALSLLNQSDSIKFFASSTFLNSELSSGYQENYTVSAEYFKLNLPSIKNNIKPNLFINEVRASYTKLTDPVEIEKHSSTHGAKAIKVNVPYDDPFFQYAEVTGEMSIAMNEVTFQESDDNQSPNQNSIILRSLPDAVILYPAKGSRENPFNAESAVVDITDTHVVRFLETTTNIASVKNKTVDRPSLPYKYTYDYLGTVKYGLIGVESVQNIIYVFDKDDFPVSYSVSGRPALGVALYNVLENTLKAKYNFTYLTWWDLFRRLSKKDFTKFIFKAPKFLLTEMSSVWRGYKFKHVLYRGPNYTLDNFTEVNPNIDDPIILSDTVDRFL